MLIECNPRVGGGLINDIHQAVWEVDMTTNFLLTMMDIPVNPPRLEHPKKCRVFYLLGAPKTGLLERVDFFEACLCLTSDLLLLYSVKRVIVVRIVRAARGPLLGQRLELDYFACAGLLYSYQTRIYRLLQDSEVMENLIQGLLTAKPSSHTFLSTGGQEAPLGHRRPVLRIRGQEW